MKASFLSSYPVVLWVLAFVCALYPINYFQMEFFSGAIVLLFVWAYILLARKLKTGWEIPRSPVLLIGVLFWVLVACSVLWSEVKPISLMGVCFLTVMPLTFVVGTLSRDEGFFRGVSIMLIPIFATLSIWAMIQFFFLNSYFYGQARHPLGDPSSLGVLLSMALFSAMGWALLEKVRWRKTAAIVLAMLLCGGILATVARGPILAFVPGLIAFLILLWPQVKNSGRSLVMVAASVAVIVGITSIPSVNKSYDYTVSSRVGDTLSLNMQDVSNNRLNIWQGTMEIIKESPLLGKGISTFFMYYPEHRLPTETAGTFHAHSDPLQFWAELGILGPVLFYAFIIGAAIRTFGALKRLEPSQEKERVIIVTLFSALMALVASSHVGFSFYNLSILMLTGFMLAVWFHYTGLAKKDEVIHATMPEKSPAMVNMAVLALPFLMMGGMFLSLNMGEIYVNRARDALFKGDMFKFADYINMAGKVSHDMNTRAYMLAVNVPMTIREDKGEYANKEMQTNLYNQVVGYMDRVLTLNPRAGEAYYYKGKIQDMVDADVVPEGTPSPEEFYMKTLRLDPMHLGARMSLAELYAKQGDKKKRQDILTGGENFTYNTPLAAAYYQMLASSYLEGGNYVKTQEVMGRMVDFKRRSDSSRARLNTSIPQAIANEGNVADPVVPMDQSFPQMPPEGAETSGKKDSGL